MPRLILAILFVALVATAGDFTWYSIGVRDRVTAGVVHGVVLLTAVGGALGALNGRLLAGLPVGAIAGATGALSYYALTPVMGRGAMIAAWAVLWIVLAFFEGRVLRPMPRPMSEVGVRGALAAALGAVAFSAVVGTLWGRPPAGGRNYLLQFVAWAVAWAPGMLALSLPLGRRR